MRCTGEAGVGVADDVLRDKAVEKRDPLRFSPTSCKVLDVPLYR